MDSARDTRRIVTKWVETEDTEEMRMVYNGVQNSKR